MAGLGPARRQDVKSFPVPRVSLALLGTFPCPITWKTSSSACCALSFPEKGESPRHLFHKQWQKTVTAALSSGEEAKTPDPCPAGTHELPVAKESWTCVPT